MATVLVVDDDALVREVVVRYLDQAGLASLEAADGDEAERILDAGGADLVVLDVMLPGRNGLDLCRRLRHSSEVPVVMLSALGQEADRLVGLELGADDYIVKPFSPREVVARVQAVLRRAGPPGRQRPQHLSAGPIEIDADTREVTKAGRPVELTATEFSLLWCLASHPKTVFSREQLLAQVWGYEFALDAGTSTVTVHVRRLREKIEDDPSQPRIVQTVWGVGYRLVP